MRDFRRGLLLFAAIFITCTPATAQIDVAASQTHRQAAFEAYDAGDFDGFTHSLEAALELNPGSLRTRYDLACGYALTGRADEALELLGQLARQKVDFGMVDDEDLESLHDLSGFHALVESLERAIEPISNSELRFELEQYGLIPEGIAVDTETGRTFLGSMRSGDILVVDSDGRLSKFATVAHDGALAAIGLAVDDNRELLWAVGAAFGTVENFDPEAPPKTGVFGFDLTTGREQHKYIADTSVRGLNDVTVGPAGDLFVSGTVLSRVRPGGDRLEAVDTDIQIVGANGVAASPDGRDLFVSSYPVGLARIDLGSGKVVFLDLPADTTSYGIDGLYWYEGGLVGVQNGVRPWRLVRMTLSEDRDTVTAVRMIEYANDYVTATTGAIVGNVIHYVGQGPDPEDPPSHFPENLRQFLGKTVVMTAPLD